MESRKRKQTQGGLLGRRVRARAEPEPDLDEYEDDASSGAPSEEEADENENESGSEAESASDDGSVGPVSEASFPRQNFKSLTAHLEWRRRLI